MQKEHWTFTNEINYKWLFNYLDKYEDNKYDTFIFDNLKKLDELINKNENWGLSAKSKLFFMVSKWLKLNNGTNKDILYFQNEGFKNYYLIQQHEKENIQDMQEIEFYKTHNELLDILKNNDLKDNRPDNQIFLLLNLLTNQPPLRNNFYITAKFIEDIKDNNKEDNYIFINNGKECYYIVNSDKVDDKYNASLIPIINKKLNKLIITNYNKYKRVYLLEDANGEPFTGRQMLNAIRLIIPGITINNFRSSYINYYYEKNESIKSRELLASFMRHSVNTANTNYKKIIEDIKEKPLINEDIKDIKETKKINEPLEGSALYNKRKRDIIRQLKLGKTIKESTKLKYNL